MSCSRYLRCNRTELVDHARVGIQFEHDVSSRPTQRQEVVSVEGRTSR